MKSARKGITMLELTVALAVAAVFATVSVSNMQGVRRRQRESSALRDISMQALQARANARTTQYAMRLAVRTNPNAPGTMLRWEELPCNTTSGKWGGPSSCPAQACVSTVMKDCSDTKCPCLAVGESIPVPPTLDVSSLHGLCWLGQGAQPRAMVDGKACTSGAPPPQTPYQVKATDTSKVTNVFVVDGLTGRARMIDCRDTPKDASCP